ncbi:MAG: thioredoxin family protein [Deltaproteobacteria bacterium]|nr:MAG: thioredoxin family protein [Deltaproteobacteria bacterium]
MAVKLGYKNVFRDPLGYPEWHARNLPIASTPAGLAQMNPEAKPPGSLQGWALMWTLLGIFAGGVALNLTPCVYPLIPVIVSYFGGRSVKGRNSLIAHGVCFIGGLAVTNSMLGTIAALTGGLMGAILQNPFVLSLVALVMIFFATSLFGVWELRLPHGLTQAAAKTYAGYFGSLFMGLTMGIVAAPCIGPFVLGLLTWVAGLGSPSLGFVIFFALSLGLGLPLFFLALFSGRLEKLPRSGEWMLWVRKLMGWVLVFMATYFFQPVIPETTGIFIFAAVALLASLHLGWIDTTSPKIKLFKWLKTGAAIAGFVIATLLIGTWILRGPGVDWQPYSESLLLDAKIQKKPVIIDFYADWCAPCRELDEVTFHHPEIVKRAKNDFVMVKVDLTRKGNPIHERLLREYDVKGVPTVVFLDQEGRERRDLRLVDFLPADQFLIRMADIKDKERRDPAEGVGS